MAHTQGDHGRLSVDEFHKEVRPERPHGYTRYKLHGCRCYICAWAVSQYTARVNKLKTLGQWQPFTDAAPVRAHLRQLSAAGIGYKQAAAAAGVSPSATGAILFGRNGKPRTTIRTETAARLLAVEPNPQRIAGGHLIDSTGTQRRIGALCFLGYSLTWQASQIGWTTANYARMQDTEQVAARTARAVTALYDRYSMTPAADTPTARRARAYAAQRRYLGPLCWDDDTIDNPAAAPVVLPAVAGSVPVDEHALAAAFIHHQHPISRDVRDELIWRLLAAGYSHGQIAPIARTTRGAVGMSAVRLRRERAATEAA